MAAKQTEVRALVERYRVCWEMFPEWSRVANERRQTGAVIELYGTHEDTSERPSAGCRRCIPVLQALLSIADFIADEMNGTLAAIRAHSGIEYATERGGRPDIVVSLTLRSPDVQATPEIETAFDALRNRLSSLGASERAWRDPDAT